jgi:hypothetical protein
MRKLLTKTRYLGEEKPVKVPVIDSIDYKLENLDTVKNVLDTHGTPASRKHASATASQVSAKSISAGA